MMSLSRAKSTCHAHGTPKSPRQFKIHVIEIYVDRECGTLCAKIKHHYWLNFVENRWVASAPSLTKRLIGA